MTKEKRTRQTEHREEKEFFEKLVELKRTSKKTQGGNRFRFSALMVVGDQNGNVGVGLGRAKDVVSAVKKGVRQARKHMFGISRFGDANTIPHDIRIKYKGAEILLKPAPSGTGVKAGGAIRTVAEAAGIRNIVGKIIGSDNKKSNIKATVVALKQLAYSPTRKIDLRNSKSATIAKKTTKTSEKTKTKTTKKQSTGKTKKD